MKKNEVLEFELWVAKLLRYGVLLVAVVLLVGWILSINFDENIFIKYQNYQEINLLLLLQQAWHSHSWGLLLSYAGLGILICLPVLRVIMTGILFAKEKEFIMMSICIVVLLGLLLSFSLGAIK